MCAHVARASPGRSEKSSENANRIHADGGTDLVLEAVKTHMESATVVMKALCALWNLSNGFTENEQKNVIMDSIPRLLLLAMIKHMQDEDVQEKVCGLLTNLGADCRRGWACDVNILFSSFVFFCAMCVMFLIFALAVTNSVERRTRMLEFGVGVLVANSLKTHPKNDGLQLHGWQLLCALSTDDTRVPTLKAGSKLAVQAMRQFPRDHALQLAVLGFLVNTWSMFLSTYHSADVLAHLLNSTVRCHAHSETVLDYLTLFVRQLVLTESFAAVQLIALDGIEHVRSIMKKFVGNERYSSKKRMRWSFVFSSLICVSCLTVIGCVVLCYRWAQIARIMFEHSLHCCVGESKRERRFV